MLVEIAGPLGCVLWRALSDVLLWCASGSTGSPCSLWFGGRTDHWLTDVETGPLAAPLRVLGSISDHPHSASREPIAEACGAVSMWSEVQGAKETALQFAEAAAFVEPDSPARCATAGRLCRRSGLYPRAAMWYRRAVRLARRDRNEVAFTIAHLGYGNLELDRGRCLEAEAHYWKAARNALRIGRTSLAGAAFHDLLGAAVHTGRMSEATEHARRAVRFYLPKHPRFPLLAHDIAFLWLRLGYFSSAIPILDQVLPLVGRQRERILVLASLARCAAAVHDRLRFERAANEVLALAEVDSEMTASSLYHVAEGARTFEEWARAEALADRAATEADRLGNATISSSARALSEAITGRVPGDKDAVPDEGGEVDSITAAVMRKLRRQPPPDPVSGAGTPERYPVG